MLTAIIDWSARNRFLVILATLFITLAGIYAVVKTPLDALPDLSDVQVIVYTEYSGQAPQVVEDQVTYPLTTAMLSVPKSKVVRGFSFFGASFVYVIFEDGTDIYWARSRVLEYLSSIAGRLPGGVSPQLGPDATGVGWVYQYAVLSEKHNLAELRTMQDWYLRYQLTKAHGVAEVASIGGFVQQYQVTVDPVKLRAYDIPLSRVSQVIRDSNRDVGGRVVEMAETEYMVRGKGYLRGKGDIENLVVKAERGTPVLLRDIARVELGPDERRGLAELNGEGEVVSGIVMARYGENALEVIENIRSKIAEVSDGLPDGVTIQAVYDRSELIHRAIATLKRTLLEEGLIVALVCIVFLMHARSALVAIVMLPVGVLIAFIVMRALGMNSNIMSLGGIAIAIGAMVDAAIVMIENAHKHLERLNPSQPPLVRGGAVTPSLIREGWGGLGLLSNRSRCLCAFSIITMAASTIAPMAIAIPPRLMMLEFMPSKRIAMMAISTPTGSITMATSALRACIRNTMHTSATMRLSSSSVRFKVSMARWIRSERSYTAWILTPSGRPEDTSAILLLTFSITSSAFCP